MSENQGSGWIDYLWLNGRLVGRLVGGQVQVVHVDQVGRPEVMTDSNRAIIWRARNFAFSRTVTVQNSIPLNLGFPGQYQDVETGMWNNGFRDYAHSLGRYVESDPAGLTAGVNTYAYTGSNPLNSSDPMGLAVYTQVPTNAVQYTSGSGATFYAPPNANFGAIQTAGESYGSNPIAMGMNEGRGGTYDFQRSNGDFYAAYTDASNYGVGVYLFGAGYSADEAVTVSEEFATLTFSANAGSGVQVFWWLQGWHDAANGNLAKKMGCQ